MTNTTPHCDTCGAGPAEACFDSATGLGTPTHPDRAAAALLVEKILIARKLSYLF